MNDGPDSLVDVADRIDRLLLWLRRQAPRRLSTTAVSTLDTLEAEGPLRISALAEREALSQPGMTTLVNKLEAAGHAERLPDPADGRAALVRITASGRQLLRERHADRAVVLLSLLDELSPADQQALRSLAPVLSRLLDIAASRRGASSPVPSILTGASSS
jgi:DNA-binding MarR family transcriptional regulator